MCFARRNAASLVSLAVLALLAPRLAAAQIAGENVNMVSGTTWPGGDPFLQRQNEPTVAVSSANPDHLVAGANDYRSVDVPNPLGSAPAKMGSDAWLGLFKSFDGGRTWQSVLLPGYPQDTSAEGAASPLRTCRMDAAGKPVPCGAAADPVVRAGTDGLFYFAGLGFTRDFQSSQVFVARLVDRNDKENGDATKARDAIQYVDTVKVAAGSPTSFLDKPWIAVDVPRPGLGTCTVAGRTIPAGAVYAVYSASALDESSSDIFFTQSLDCGAHWSAPLKLNTKNSVLNQGPSIAIEPITGRVYVTWRRAASGKQAPAIMVTRSNGRKKQFSNPRAIAPLAQFDQLTSFTLFRTQTMPSLAISSDGTRSWAHVAWAQRIALAGGDARVVVSSAVVHPPPSGDQDDDEAEEVEDDTRVKWSAPAEADPLAVADEALHAFSRGQQLMPSLTFSQGRLVLAWYDTRLDHTRSYWTPNVDASGTLVADGLGRFYREERGPLGSLAWNKAGWDAAAGTLDDAPLIALAGTAPAGASEYRHTVDVRVAFAPAGGAPAFSSTSVTRFPFGVRGDEASGPGTAAGFGGPIALVENGRVKVLQGLAANPPNLPMFKGGTVPFLGDYIDIQGPSFIPTALGGWAFNLARTASPVFHAVWTSNQDVRPPRDGDWSHYTPVRLPGQTASVFDPAAPTSFCTAGSGGFEATRDQNIYTSRVTEGLVVSSPQNVKPLSRTIVRGFVVNALNTTDRQRTFRYSLQSVPPGVAASFRNDGAALPGLDVIVPKGSSATRTAFLRLDGTNPFAGPSSGAIVDVTEVGGCGAAGQPACLSGFVSLNPPGASPILQQPDMASGLPSVVDVEAWASSIQDPALFDPNASRGGGVLAPDPVNPNMFNPNMFNPNMFNPDVAAVGATPNMFNPNMFNPNMFNPNMFNPNMFNPNMFNATVSDLSWTVENTGNTTTSYHLQFVGSAAANAVPQPLQLIVTKPYANPVAKDCALLEKPVNLVEVNVPDISGALVGPTAAVDPNVPDPRAANVTFQLRPGEQKLLTLRAFVPARDMALLGGRIAPAVVAHGATPAPGTTYADIVGLPTRTTLVYSGTGALASVTPAGATGTITFVRNAGEILWSGPAHPFPPATPEQARAAIDVRLAPGDTLVAYYSGDATHLASTSGIYTAGTTLVTLTVGQALLSPGGVTSLRAQVSDGAGAALPGIAVTFFEDPATIVGSSVTGATGLATIRLAPGLGAHAYHAEVTVGGATASSTAVGATVAGWVPQPDMPVPQSLASSSAIGADLWMVPTAATVGGALQAFDTVAQTWRRPDPRGTVPAGPSVAFGGRLLVFAPSLPVTTYDPATNTAQQATTAAPAFNPSGLSAFRAVVASGRVFIIDGTGALWEYVPAGDQFVARAAAPSPARLWVTVGTAGGRIYVLGGVFLHQTPPVTLDVDVYDPATDTWSKAAPLPVSRNIAATAELGGKLYLFGGFPDASDATPDVLVYDPGTNAWTTNTSMPTARYGMAAAAAGGVVWVVGGAYTTGSAPPTLVAGPTGETAAFYPAP